MAYNIVSNHPKHISFVSGVPQNKYESNFNIFHKKDNFHVDKQELYLPPIKSIKNFHLDDYNSKLTIFQAQKNHHRKRLIL